MILTLFAKSIKFYSFKEFYSFNPAFRYWFFQTVETSMANELNVWKNQNTRLKAIPKSSFPTLVRKALDAMDNYSGGGSISNDLQASFKATGIYPLNKQNVMDKLPNTDDSNILVNDTVTEYLKSQRYPNNDENARKKRKKITVVAGASITMATLSIIMKVLMKR